MADALLHQKFVSCDVIHEEVPLNVKHFTLFWLLFYSDYNADMLIVMLCVIFCTACHRKLCREPAKSNSGSAAYVLYLFNNRCVGILRHTEAACFDKRIHKLAEFTENERFTFERNNVPFENVSLTVAEHPPQDF